MGFCVAFVIPRTDHNEASTDKLFRLDHGSCGYRTLLPKRCFDSCVITGCHWFVKQPTSFTPFNPSLVIRFEDSRFVISRNTAMEHIRTSEAIGCRDAANGYDGHRDVHRAARRSCIWDQGSREQHNAPSCRNESLNEEPRSAIRSGDRSPSEETEVNSLQDEGSANTCSCCALIPP